MWGILSIKLKSNQVSEKNARKSKIRVDQLQTLPYNITHNKIYK